MLMKHSVFLLKYKYNSVDIDVYKTIYIPNRKKGQDIYISDVDTCSEWNITAFLNFNSKRNSEFQFAKRQIQQTLRHISRGYAKK